MEKLIRSAVATSAVLVLGSALMLAVVVGAQSTKAGDQPAATRKQSFDVISIKPDNNPDVDPTGQGLAPTGGFFSVTKQRPLDLIAIAYNLSGYYYRALIPQLPKWATTERFDVEARATGNPTEDQMHSMEQSMLADRFKFAMHYEDRQVPFYALVLVKPGKLGPNIRPYGNEEPCTRNRPSSPTVAGGFPTLCGIPRVLPASQPGLFRVGFRNVSMEELATYTTGMGELDRPVLDHTGLNGTFDLIVEYDHNANNGPQAEPIGPTLFEAMKNELGLKLEEQTGPVKIFVIDHIEEPSPN
jgi:uncharacterized protein (TIGR03435 family)